MNELREALLPKKWFRFLYLDERDQAVYLTSRGPYGRRTTRASTTLRCIPRVIATTASPLE